MALYWSIENLAATFVPGLAEIPGGDPSTGSYRYYMGNHLGSVRTLRDQNKAALASYEFMPYGETYLQSGRELYRGFTGHMLEKETGLYFAPYRYYSPVASRWLTRDPLGMIDGLNVYAYVGYNPIGATDPDGLFAVPIALIRILMLLSGLITAGYLSYECGACLSRAIDTNIDASQKLCDCEQYNNWVRTAKPGSECSSLCAGAGQKLVEQIVGFMKGGISGTPSGCPLPPPDSGRLPTPGPRYPWY